MAHGKNKRSESGVRMEILPDNASSISSRDLASFDATSFQIFQDMYSKLTGKSEQMSKIMFDKHQATLANFENLSHVIDQTVEQYQCHKKNLSISVSYTDGKSERFSGIEKFRMQASNKSVCVDDVTFEYDLLLTLPQTTEPKIYKIIVGLRSEIGMFDKIAKGNLSSFEKRIMTDLSGGTARLSISYIDLAVANSLEAAIISWFKSIPVLGNRKTSQRLEPFLPFMETISRVTMLVAGAIMLLSFFSDDVFDVSDLFFFGLWSSVVLLSVNIISLKITSNFSSLIQDLSPRSSINLSAADASAITKYSKSSVVTFSKVVAYVVGPIIVGIVSTIVLKMFGI